MLCCKLNQLEGLSNLSVGEGQGDNKRGDSFTNSHPFVCNLHPSGRYIWCFVCAIAIVHVRFHGLFRAFCLLLPSSLPATFTACHYLLPHVSYLWLIKQQQSRCRR